MKCLGGCRDSEQEMIQSVCLVVKLQESLLDVRVAPPFPVSTDRVCDLARRLDVVGVKTILLQARLCLLDEFESALTLLLQGDSNGIVAHQAEVLEERSESARS